MASIAQSVVNNTQFSVTTHTTIAATINGVKAGSNVRVAVSWDNSASQTCTVSDGVAYTPATQVSNPVTQATQVFHRENVNAGNYTVTATFSAACAFTYIRVWEETGETAFDTSGGQSQATPTTVADATTSGNVTPGQSGEFVVGWSMNVDGTGGAPATGTGFTSFATDATAADRLEFRNTLATAAALAATFTAASNVTHNSHIILSVPSANVAPMMPAAMWSHSGKKLGFAKMLQAVAAVLNNITGSAGFQNGTDSIAVTATETFSATVVLKNGADKLLVTATETISGTAVLKNGTDSLAATAQERFSGTTALKGGPDALAANAAEVFAAIAGLKNGLDHLAATATETIGGAVGLTNGADQLSATDGSTPPVTDTVSTINAPLVFGTLLNRN